MYFIKKDVCVALSTLTYINSISYLIVCAALHVRVTDTLHERQSLDTDESLRTQFISKNN